MKQFLRLGDCYALAKHKLKQVAVSPHTQPSSAALPSVPIRMCPAYTSLKRPKSGILAKDKRLYSEGEAHTEGYRTGQAHVGAGQGSASELILYSDYPRIAQHLAGPNGGQSEYSASTAVVHTELRIDPEEISGRRTSQCLDSESAIVRNWFAIGQAIVWHLFGCASVFSRSVAEGLSKASRTLVEALSKDCRTSLEQQSNNGRRNIEESCVCTHAKVPARYGLGLALGMVVFFLLAIGTRVHAQMDVQHTASLDSIKPLQIGDTIPEALWQLPLQVVNHPDRRDTITLDDYRDKKLIILDFWATWCKPCIQSLPQMDALQHAFANELLILPVAYERREKVGGFLNQRTVSLPSIVSDMVLRSYFPYQVMPHHVWIYGGRVIASTSISYANARNIAKVLDGDRIKMIMTGNAPPARNATHNNEKLGCVLYQSVFTGAADGHLPGVGQTGGRLDARNLHLQALIKTAYADDFDWIDHDSRWVIDLPDTLKSRIVLPAERYGNGYEADSLFRLWLDNNTYCYSLSVPKAMEEKQLRSIMRRDLLEFLSNGFDISVGIETGLRPCFLVEVGEQLRQTAGGEPLYQYTASHFRMANKPLELLIHAINQAGAFDLPVILGGAVPGENVDVEINGGLKNKMGIQRALDGLGLKITKAQHRLEVIMLKQINPNTNQS